MKQKAFAKINRKKALYKQTALDKAANNSKHYIQHYIQ